MNDSRFLRLLRETEDLRDDAAWLKATLGILGPEIDDGLGAAVMKFDVGDLQKIRVEHPMGMGLPSDLTPARMLTATMQAPPAYVQATYRAFDCITASEVGPVCEREFVSRTLDYGFQDTFCLAAIMPNDVGCAVFAGRRKRTAIGRRARDRWRTVTQELQRVLLHRAAAATQASDASTRVEKRGGSHASIRRLTSTNGWEQVAAGGWTPVRGYSVGGKAFVVVTESARDPASILTRREREVCILAVQGLAYKVIGHELGISTSTVGVLLWRAMTKLGVENRTELKAALR